MRLALPIALAACGTAAAGPQTIAWQRPIEIANGGGEKGPWRQNDSRFDYVDDPSVALGRGGAAAVAWVDHRTRDVWFQMFEPNRRARHARPVNVSRTPDVFSWLPRVVVAGRDVFVLWQEIVFSGGTHGGEMFFARSRDGGATFDAPINLSRSTPGDGKGRFDRERWSNGSFDLAIAGDGTLHAAWTEFDGPLWTARSTDRGATFTAPRQIAERAPARAPALASARDAIYLAWTVGDDRGADIRVAVSRDGGVTFGAPVVVARTPTYSDAPKIAVGRGVVHVTYAETSGGPHDRAAIRYTRSRDGGRTFERPRTISASRGAGSATYPQLALDGDRVVVAWDVAARVGQPPRGLAIAYSIDGGDRFTAPALIDGSVDPGGGWNGSHQGRLMRKLAVRDGAIAVVTSALAHGVGSRVWLVGGAMPSAAAP